MKLKKCIEIGKECGLTTVGECIDNINIHSMNLFEYTKIDKELNELYVDLAKSGLSEKSLI